MTDGIVTYNGHGLPTIGHPRDAMNAMRYIVQAHAGERLVVLRGRDLLAFPSLMGYAELAKDFGMVDEYSRDRDRFLYGQASRMEFHALALRDWQRANPTLVRLPTVPDDFDPSQVFTS